MNKPAFSEEDARTQEYEVQFSQSSFGSNQSIHVNYAYTLLCVNWLLSLPIPRTHRGPMEVLHGTFHFLVLMSIYGSVRVA